MADADPLLLPGDVIRFDDDPPRDYRIVWVDPAVEQVVLFDLAQKRTVFSLYGFADLADHLRDGSASRLLEHGYDAEEAEHAITKARRERREHLMATIRPLLEIQPELFDDRKRGSAIAQIAAAGGPDAKTIHSALHRYFAGGMVPNAIMPRFEGCGGPGKAKRRGAAKLGRKRKHGRHPGTNVTPWLERIFEHGIRLYYAQNGRIAFTKARALMLKKFCMSTRVDPVTRRIVHTAEPLYSDEGFPTVRQIRYWFEAHADIFEFRRQRIGRKKYDRNLRGVLGKARATTFGPGSRYEIDATIANVYIVSSIEDGVVIGRPVIYIVVDVFSKMVVGVYVGLEGPSWLGAMMALVNVVTPKIEFCAKYGVVIDEADWPCHFLPEKILGDRGEIAARAIENLQSRHHMTVENAESHRPDWKGTVEKRFDLVDTEFRPFATGYVDPDFGERGVKDPRLEAAWTLEDFTAALIMIILYFNNHVKLDGYPRDGQMIREGVRAVPAELWEWGIARRQGGLRRASIEDVQFSVMPEAVASVRRDGIYFRGLYYSCSKAEGERWFDRARQQGIFKKRISFDPRRVRYIYLHDPGEPCGYIVCELLDWNADIADASFAEVIEARRRDKSHTADRSVSRSEAEADLAAFLEGCDLRARNRVAGYDRRPCDLEDIRGARGRERDEIRRREAFDLGGAATDQPPASNVHPLRGAAAADEDDGAEPTLSQVLGKGKTP
ncbi:MAG TPA: hypothetical protein VF688_11335 [Allosphingosinicella sp.]|jgi:hypothetical protein